MGRLRQSTEAIQRILDESDGLREFTERELNTLKGEGEGSIKQALNEVLGGASEAYDTLKEIEEYIEKDEAGAVALTQSITRLETEKVSKEDIDSALSTTSENPVMNKVITEELSKIPFEKGSAENSAVLKGGNNEVISKGGVAVGSNNIVGLKGFYYKYIRFVSNTLANVYLSRTQTVPTVTTGNETKDTTIIPSDYYAIGDSVSIINDSKYDNIAVINNMSEGIIQIKWNTETPFDSITEETDLEPEDYSIYSLDKPTKGLSDLGHNSFAAGYNNEATNVGAAAFGRGNKAYGKFAFTEGRDNTAAYSSHTEGRENVNDGYFSHVEGYSNENYSNNSHVEGTNNINNSKRGHIEGIRNKADNIDNVHIEGALNYFGTEDVPIPDTSILFRGTTHIEGQGNIDKGSSSSHTEGRQNINHGAAYSHVEGRQNVLLNTNSSRGCHVEGYSNKADGAYLHVEGNSNKAYGQNGHVEGRQNVINNQSEHASGQYNVSIVSTDKSKATSFSHGIGTSDNDRKNAFEVKQNGDIYVEGVEGRIQDKLNATDTLDTQLTELSNKVDNLPQGDEFDKQGNYPLLHVGTADDLAGRGESVPASFGFRASGGKSIKDGRAYIKRIKGNSVVWNQIVPNSLNPNTPNMSINKNGNSYTFNVAGTDVINQLSAKISQTTKVGHIYLFIRIGDNSLGKIPTLKLGTSYLAVPSEYNFLTAADESTIAFYPWGGTAETISEGEATYTLRLFDLTQMFQAGNEPSTIEEFNARVSTIGIDMYAYNEGEVIHMNTESIKSVGDNAWDEEWESGIIGYNTGKDTNSANHCRTVGYTKVIPNEQYYISFPTASIVSSLVVICYDANKAFIQHIGGGSANKTFTIPANCHYIRFTWEGTEYNNNIMLTLVHSGWKQDTDAGYQPYWQDTLPLPIIRNYFPDGMKKAGSAHDEIRFNKATKKWEYSKGKIIAIKMKDLTWDVENAEKCVYRAGKRPVAGPNNLICARYATSSLKSGTASMEDMAIMAHDTDKVFYVRDTRYTSAADFIASLTDNDIIYCLASDWEWVELDAEDQNFRDYYNVADFGTEQSQSNVPSAPFSADIIYQFNAVDMIREHELEITELQKVIATMQAQLTSLTNGVE